MAAIGRASSACATLNSFHRDCHYELKEEKGPPHAKHYVFSVVVMGVEYFGHGRSKKLAKQAAAQNALNSLYNIRLGLGTGAYSMPGERSC